MAGALENMLGEEIVRERDYSALVLKEGRGVFGRITFLQDRKEKALEKCSMKTVEAKEVMGMETVIVITPLQVRVKVKVKVARVIELAIAESLATMNFTEGGLTTCELSLEKLLLAL